MTSSAQPRRQGCLGVLSGRSGPGLPSTLSSGPTLNSGEGGGGTPADLGADSDEGCSIGPTVTGPVPQGVLLSVGIRAVHGALVG